MRIGLIGYGKMGKEIEAIAFQRGHDIAFRLTSQSIVDIDTLQEADVVIEFTKPEAAIQNYMDCFNAKVPVVSGTTGWLDQRNLVEREIKEKDATFFYASNFSLGVNLFFHLNKKLSKLMKEFDQYNVSMSEIHHTQKLDAPSGTAISLAEGIIESSSRFSDWSLDEGQEMKKSVVPIEAIRENDVPGTHTIKYDSEVDSIEISHVAKSRKGFALGAVIAAEFSIGKKGWLDMDCLLQIN